MAKGPSRATNNPEMSHVTKTTMHEPFTTKQAGLTGGNPYNEHVGDEAGVLGPMVKGQNAGRNYDTPVLPGASLPNTNIVSKAQEQATAPNETFPGDGVLGRG